MNASEICWGILGCGDVTEVKSGPALQNANRSSVAAVMRRDGAKAQDYATRHGIDTWYDDARSLINDKNVNAIYIATPPESHMDLTMQALASGKPVFVEKPMARNVAECDAMIEAADAADQSLIVAYYRRALPRFEKMRQIVQDGTIGTPRLARITQFSPRQKRDENDWRVNPETAGGGLFYDTQSHTLDWLHYVFGTPHNISGLKLQQADEYPAEDFVSYTCQFGDIAVAGTSAFTVGESREEVTIYGDTGSVSMSFFSYTPLTLKKDGQMEIIAIADPAHMHQPFVEAIVAHLLDGTENPCSGRDARQVNAVLEEIYQV